MVRNLDGVLSLFIAVMTTGMDIQKGKTWKYGGKEKGGKDGKKAGREGMINSERRKTGREERKDGGRKQQWTGQKQKIQ